MILASLLSNSKYIIVNKDLLKMLGLNESVILGELCSEYSHWESIDQLEDAVYFYSTRENIKKISASMIIFKELQRRILKKKEY